MTKCVVCGGRSITEKEHPQDVQAALGVPPLCPKHYAELGFNYQFILGVRVADIFLERAKTALRK